MFNRQELEKKITTLEEELKKYKTQWTEELSKDAETRVADLLHEILCRGNHTDGCSWFYETNYTNSSSTKARYIGKARKLLKNSDEDVVIDILTKLAGL